ncbi:MAG TPA: mechanosensitive ion channel [Candidatus Paceibacterota bacterium]|nr:mechanosensitive ion channel [Candidatus Paceibacterota bacterium]
MNNLVFLNDIAIQLSSYLPTLIGALAILLLGWIIGLVVAGIVRGALRRTTVDEKIAGWLLGSESVRGIEVERWIAKAVFYLVLLFTLVAFFETLGLTLIADSLDQFLGEIGAYIPRFIEAAFVLALAWVVASGARMVIKRVLGLAKIDSYLEMQAGVRREKRTPLAKTLSDAVYWLVFLLFLPALLDALEVGGLLGPVQGMTNEILSFLPNILAAGLVLLIGWFVARIVERIATNLLMSVGVDQIAERVGLGQVLGSQTLSGMLGRIAYVLVLIPVLIASLHALGLEAITQPASNMLNIILAAVPSIFAAVLVMAFAYILGRIVGGLVTNLLANIGFDKVLVMLGFGEESSSRWKPSDVVGYLALVAIILFAFVESLSLLGFGVLANLTAEFIVFSGHIILGVVIFAIGLYLANVASNTVAKSKNKKADFLALAAKISILVFAGAMALRQMGLANDIINIAFALVVGAVAVAFVLALGLGGRDVAAAHLEEWVKAFKKKR